MVADLLGIHIPAERRPDLPGEAQETLADISMARSVGWGPKIGLLAGLQTMVDFIRSEMDAGRA